MAKELYPVIPGDIRFDESMNPRNISPNRLAHYAECPKELMRDRIFASPVYRDFEMGISSVAQFYEAVTCAIQLRMDMKQFYAGDI